MSLGPWLVWLVELVGLLFALAAVELAALFVRLGPRAASNEVLDS